VNQKNCCLYREVWQCTAFWHWEKCKFYTRAKYLPDEACVFIYDFECKCAEARFDAQKAYSALKGKEKE